MEISKKHPPFLHYLIISRTLACIPPHALKGQKLYLSVWNLKAFALTGRITDCYYTQGDALG